MTHLGSGSMDLWRDSTFPAAGLLKVNASELFIMLV
jgi:hypothetical protein